MELNEICISLDQARKLKKLGFERDSLYYYWICTLYWDELMKIETKEYFWNWNNYLIYPAYTASEIIELFPEQINFSNICSYILNINKYDDKYYIRYENNDEWFLISISYSNLAQALWDMLIYLVSNWYIKND